MNHFRTFHDLTGVVCQKNNGSFGVRCAEKTFICTLAGHLSPSSKPANRSKPIPLPGITVGDQVIIKDAGNGSGTIVEILERRNFLSRRAAGGFSGEQILAANLDQVVPVFSAAQPEPHWRLLDRYLAAAETQGIPALICISKADLIPENENHSMDSIQAMTTIYRQIGYPVVWVSAASGDGLAELRLHLAGKFSAFLGKSGVGKTSLLNALQPELVLSTGEVNAATGKGRHTTTRLEAFPLEGGGSVLDSPGNREFGVWDVQKTELAFFFREMSSYVGKCKYGLNCLHDEEPGCAVRAAVTGGMIHPYRYQSYLYLLEEL